MSEIMTHRKEIEHFCLQLFNDVADDDNINHLRCVINNYKHLVKVNDIQQLHLTRETFDISFQDVCKKVFSMRPADKNYIFTVLTYAVCIHEFHIQFSSWYTHEMLVQSLTIVLEEISFNPNEFCISNKTTNSCIILQKIQKKKNNNFFSLFVSYTALSR